MIKRGFDYLITIDSDNPPILSVVSLIFLDKPVIACPTPVSISVGRRGDRPFNWNCLDGGLGNFREHTPCEELQAVEAGGTGCMVIQRAALEAIEHPFSEVFSERGTLVLSHDIAFCLRLMKEAGIPTYAHYDYPCRHIRVIDLYDVAVAWNGFRDGDFDHLVRICPSDRKEVDVRD